jgi:Tol biopolymer transport system component
MNADGSGQQPLSNGDGSYYGEPRFSPDGKWFAFGRCSGGCDMYIMPATGLVK